jgi:hypothetical protein
VPSPRASAGALSCGAGPGRRACLETRRGRRTRAADAPGGVCARAAAYTGRLGRARPCQASRPLWPRAGRDAGPEATRARRLAAAGRRRDASSEALGGGYPYLPAPLPRARVGGAAPGSTTSLGAVTKPGLGRVGRVGRSGFSRPGLSPGGGSDSSHRRQEATRGRPRRLSQCASSSPPPPSLPPSVLVPATDAVIITAPPSLGSAPPSPAPRPRAGAARRGRDGPRLNRLSARAPFSRRRAGAGRVAEPERRDGIRRLGAARRAAEAAWRGERGRRGVGSPLTPRVGR